MMWKPYGAVGALLVVAGVVAGLAGSVASRTWDPAPTVQRAAAMAGFRRPAAIPFPAGNPYSAAKADLGRSLFFDPILSGPMTRSCASCHLPGQSWADGRGRAAALDGGAMSLRTPTLLDVAWIDRLGWDGKFRDLESVAFAPITAKANMNLPVAEAVVRLSAHAAYAAAFAAAFPEARDADGRVAVTQERIEAALATFERLLVSGRAPFDRWIAGEEAAIPAAAKRGFALFTGRANCAACHGGPALTDGSFHDIGSARDDDIGRGRHVPGSAALRYAFKTPTLRNVAERAPYMHDGSLATLAAVVDLYDRGGIARPSRSREIRPLNLSQAEKADLIAFLNTLSSSEESPALGTLAEVPHRP